MGLDMYLYRVPKECDPEKLFRDGLSTAKKRDKRRLDERLPIPKDMAYYYEKVDEKYVLSESFVRESVLEDADLLNDEAIYWRKFNAVHRWFVNNVQGGKDDCGIHKPVGADKLGVLAGRVRRCLDVIWDAVKGERYEIGEVSSGSDMTVLPSACVVNGQKLIDFGTFSCTWTLKDRRDISRLEAELPTCEGFFFGPSSYGSYYAQDMQYTHEKLSELLKSTDFSDWIYYYGSSW